MQTFKDIIGHQENIDILTKAVKSGKVAHAYLFVGTAGVGKGTTAAVFARSLLCQNPVDGESCGLCKSCRQFAGSNHPDYYPIVPTGASIKLEQIHQLQKNAHYRSFQGGRQVYTIAHCETMTAEAANALLKTLEEPPGSEVFILMSSRPYAILPTILSRCQQLWFKPMVAGQVMEGLERYTDLTLQEKQVIVAQAGGSLGRALALTKGNAYASREKVLTILKMSVSGDMVELLQQAALLASDRAMARQWAQLLQLWLRDLLIWRLTADQSLLINTDLAADIAAEADRYTVEQLVGMMEETEKAITRLEAKGNIRLVLEVLLLQLAQIAGKERSC